MVNIPLVAYYTPDYEHFAQRMIRSVTKQPIHLLPVSSLGSWMANLTLKPRIIRETLNHIPEFVYVDIDSVFRNPVPITPLPKDKDVGLVPLNQPPAVIPYAAALIQVRYDVNTIRWLDAWIQLYEKMLATGMRGTDHNAMINVLNMVRVQPLPITWMYTLGFHDKISIREVCIEYKESGKYEKVS